MEWEQERFSRAAVVLGESLPPFSLDGDGLGGTLGLIDFGRGGGVGFPLGGLLATCFTGLFSA